MLKKLSYLLILAGIILVIWPKGSEWVSDWRQDRLLAQMEREAAAHAAEKPPADLAAGYAELSSLFEQEADNADGPEPSPIKEEEPDPPGSVIIQIDKIDLKLPVLEGATLKNMKYAAAHMTETTPFGEIGNAAIAAHRARTTGRLFNRLDEMEVGDKISLKIENVKTDYEVYKISLVEPTDLSVLEGNGKDQILTLITCDPIVNATHRLIVQAKRV